MPMLTGLLLTRAGITTSDTRKDESLKPRGNAPIVETLNLPTSQFCDECGQALSEEAMNTLEKPGADTRRHRV